MIQLADNYSEDLGGKVNKLTIGTVCQVDSP